MLSSLLSSADIFANILCKCSQPSLQLTQRSVVTDDSHDEPAASTEHLVYFDFTAHLPTSNKSGLRSHSKEELTNHRSESKHCRKSLESLFKLLTLCIDKYSAKNIKVISSHNRKAAASSRSSSISSSSSASCNSSSVSHDDNLAMVSLLDIDMDIAEVLKQKIDVLYTKCSTGDINDHFDYILKHFHGTHCHRAYRKISIVGMTETETQHKCVEYSLVDKQRITQNNQVLHVNDEKMNGVDFNYILSLLDEYFFVNELSCFSLYSSTSLTQRSNMMNELQSRFAMPGLDRSDSSVFC